MARKAHVLFRSHAMTLKLYAVVMQGRNILSCAYSLRLHVGKLSCGSLVKEVTPTKLSIGEGEATCIRGVGERPHNAVKV